MTTLAERRAERHRLTAANGGLAPVKLHNRATYSNWACRCKRCVADHRRYMVAYRKHCYALTAANGGVAPVKVHNYSTRDNWGCGCEKCLRSKADKNRRRPSRRKASA